MKTLGNTVGTRINFFDGVDNPTVAVFNELFPECPIRNKDTTLLVSIGTPAANNCRIIQVGDETLTHKMYSDILYTLDRQDYGDDETDKELDEINGVLV